MKLCFVTYKHSITFTSIVSCGAALIIAFTIIRIALSLLLLLLAQLGPPLREGGRRRKGGKGVLSAMLAAPHSFNKTQKQLWSNALLAATNDLSRIQTQGV